MPCDGSGRGLLGSVSLIPIRLTYRLRSEEEYAQWKKQTRKQAEEVKASIAAAQKRNEEMIERMRKEAEAARQPLTAEIRAQALAPASGNHAKSFRYGRRDSPVSPGIIAAALSIPVESAERTVHIAGPVPPPGP